MLTQQSSWLRFHLQHRGLHANRRWVKQWARPPCLYKACALPEHCFYQHLLPSPKQEVDLWASGTFLPLLLHERLMHALCHRLSRLPRHAGSSQRTDVSVIAHRFLCEICDLCKTHASPPCCVKLLMFWLVPSPHASDVTRLPGDSQRRGISHIYSRWVYYKAYSWKKWITSVVRTDRSYHLVVCRCLYGVGK